MAGTIQGVGAVLIDRAEDQAEAFARAYNNSTFGLSAIFGDKLDDGTEINAAGVRFLMQTGRLGADGPRATNNRVPGNIRSVNGADNFTRQIPFVHLTAEWAMYAAQVRHDLPTNAMGAAASAAIGTSQFSELQKKTVVADVRKKAAWDICGGDRTSSAAVVGTAGAALGANTLPIRRSVNTVATAGNRGSQCLGIDGTYVLRDAQGARVGANTYRITDITFGAQADDTITITPVTDVAVAAGTRLVEGDDNGDAFGFGYYSLVEQIGDALDSPTIYGASRITYPRLSSQINRAGAMRSFVPALVNQLFQQIMGNADLDENDRYILATTPGIADDIWNKSGTAQVAGLDQAPIGGIAIDQNMRYAPALKQKWGTGTVDVMAPAAPGGMVTLVVSQDFRPNTVFALPVSKARKAIRQRPEWLPGALTGGTGQKVANFLQADSTFWTIATQYFINLPACGRIDQLADFVVPLSQG